MGYGYLTIPPRGGLAGKVISEAPSPLTKLYNSTTSFYPENSRLSSTGIAVPIVNDDEHAHWDCETYREAGDAGDMKVAGDLVFGLDQIDRRMFMKGPGGAYDQISEASYEEQIPLDDEDAVNAANGNMGVDGVSGGGDGDISGGTSPYEQYMACRSGELAKLSADTPHVRLQQREREAEKCAKDHDYMTALRLRREALAIAKLIVGTYSQGSSYPQLLAGCQHRLAQAYFDIKYMAQTAEHASRALEHLSCFSSSSNSTSTKNLESEIHILMGESLLRQKDPKPQAALQHLVMAAGCEGEELLEVKDLGLKALISQCHALNAEALLHEARVQKAAFLEAERLVGSVSHQLETLNRLSIDRARLQHQLAHATRQAAEGGDRLSSLCQAALSSFGLAQDLLLSVNEGVTKQLQATCEAEGADYNEEKKKNTLLMTLVRRGMELFLLEAHCHMLGGNYKQQAKCYDEIKSNQASYGCLPASLMATCYRERGTALVHCREYEGAMAEYEELLNTQTARFSSDPTKLGMNQAEVFKLMGDVHLANKDFANARLRFEQAQVLYQEHVGLQSEVVTDLADRLHQVRLYEEDVKTTAKARALAQHNAAAAAAIRGPDSYHDYPRARS